MYLFEWMLHEGVRHTTYAELKEWEREQSAKKGAQEGVPPARVDQPMSGRVFDNDSLYVFNDTYIDVRTPNDEKRGLITLMSLGVCGGYFYIGGKLVLALLSMVFSGKDLHGSPINEFAYIASIVIPAVYAAVAWVFCRYVGPYMRLELLTARRIIVRFNRVTRRVYLLRPESCGGIVSLDWDQTEVAVDKNMRGLEGMGGFLYMGWVGEKVGVDAEGSAIQYEAAMVGKTTRNAEELLAFWEYIRRYMEEGPQAVPAPERLLQKFPWPWNSFKAVWGLDTSFLGDSRLWIFVLLRLMVLPAVILQGLGHWVSLLLCYEPKFPNDIENAGR